MVEKRPEGSSKPDIYKPRPYWTGRHRSMIPEQNDTPKQDEILTGEELEKVYSRKIGWLKETMDLPIKPTVEGGLVKTIVQKDNKKHPLIYQVERYCEDGTWEEYDINPERGLVSFKKTEHGVKINSSILGEYLQKNCQGQPICIQAGKFKRSNL